MLGQIAKKGKEEAILASSYHTLEEGERKETGESESKHVSRVHLNIKPMTSFCLLLHGRVARESLSGYEAFSQQG